MKMSEMNTSQEQFMKQLVAVETAAKKNKNRIREEEIWKIRQKAGIQVLFRLTL